MRGMSLGLGAVAVAFGSSIALAIAPLDMRWEGMLKGNGNSKINGVISIAKGEDGKALATVEFEGDTPGVTRPWHVHVGSCTKGGGVLGGAMNYRAVTVSDKGHGMQVANLPVAVPDTGSFYVNIHESSTNMGSVVACGDLKMKH
jgi:superoxide dismutase, Cu-Zn family